MINRQMLSVRLEGSNIFEKREELSRYFHQSYNLFESLFELLAGDEVFYRQSEPTRHPMIFYFGHTAVFYINKLILAGALHERINPVFESLFAVGVDEMSWDEESGRFAWPAVNEVRAYRKRVREIVEECIRTLPMSLPVTRESVFWAIWMGIEHERIHIETSSVLHRQMPLRFIRPHADFPACPDSAAAPLNSLIHVSGTTIVLGKGENDNGLYGWDNEYGTSTYAVEGFEASKYLVSNGEFLEFVQGGGYTDTRWWDEEGKKFLVIRQAVCPPFWILRDDGSYGFRVLAEEIELPLNWPVEVSALEAQAFCRWKSTRENEPFRLPTEAEWTAILIESGMNDAVLDDGRANINLAHYASSAPVDRFKQGAWYDVVGNVWQWTQTPIDGFEGFAPHPWYDDFSTPTFDTKHNLIKGGSWISTGNEIVATSRYAFRRHFIQHAGFRYVRGDSVHFCGDDRVIEEDDIARLCEEGYGGGNTFAQRALEAMTPWFGNRGSVMEVGCGAGRLSMELSRYFDEVTGIDFSARFIAPAVELLERGRIRYRDTESVRETTLASLNLPFATDRVRFYQGDKTNLKPHFGGYDCIILNLMREKDENITELIENLRTRLNRAGRIIILSPRDGAAQGHSFTYLRRQSQQMAYMEIWES